MGKKNRKKKSKILNNAKREYHGIEEPSPPSKKRKLNNNIVYFETNNMHTPYCFDFNMEQHFQNHFNNLFNRSYVPDNTLHYNNNNNNCYISQQNPFYYDKNVDLNDNVNNSMCHPNTHPYVQYYFNFSRTCHNQNYFNICNTYNEADNFAFNDNVYNLQINTYKNHPDKNLPPLFSFSANKVQSFPNPFCINDTANNILCNANAGKSKEKTDKDKLGGSSSSEPAKGSTENKPEVPERNATLATRNSEEKSSSLDASRDESNPNNFVSDIKKTTDFVALDEISAKLDVQSCPSGVEQKKLTNDPVMDLEFISEDPEENKDNFDSRWEMYKSAARDVEKCNFIRMRWGNNVFPDPSVDLTYRHRQNSVANTNRNGQEQNKTKKKKKKRRSISCISHIEKLMEGMKKNYCSEIQKLLERQDLQLSRLSKKHTAEFQGLAKHSIRDLYNFGKQVESVLERQTQAKEKVIKKFQRSIQDLSNKTTSSLARYEKYATEIMAFHIFYNRDRSLKLTNEQCLLIEETGRMYKLYDKIYTEK